MNFDRFKSEDWPMLPHSEPESYPDDWEQIKPTLERVAKASCAKNREGHCRQHCNTIAEKPSRAQ